MNLIIHRNNASRARVIACPSWLLWSLGLPLVTLLLLGLLQAVNLGFMLSGGAAPWADRSGVLAEVREQRAELERIRRQSEAHLDAMAMRLGELQARSMRLEAIGSQLVETTDIDAAVFELAQSPAVGGPADDQALAGWAFAELDRAVETLDRQLAFQQGAFDGVGSLIRDQVRQRAQTPAGRPVDNAWISSGYGRRSDPFHGRPTYHRGVDFAGQPGSAVLSVADGVVTLARRNAGFGKLIEIDHGNGYLTRYAHLEAFHVRAGERVRAGQVIGALGSTGRATGPHVHFEVLKHGSHVNPMDFIRDQRGT